MYSSKTCAYQLESSIAANPDQFAYVQTKHDHSIEKDVSRFLQVSPLKNSQLHKSGNDFSTFPNFCLANMLTPPYCTYKIWIECTNCKPKFFNRCVYFHPHNYLHWSKTINNSKNTWIAFFIFFRSSYLYFCQ